MGRTIGMTKARELAADIIMTSFEELLEKHKIDIPDEGRSDIENAAHICGVTYYDLEDEITEKIKNAYKGRHKK